jgi:cysteinyl-tRNA synthetase
MDDDFNTPKALALVFDMVRLVRPLIDRGGADARVAGYLAKKNLLSADGLFRFLPYPTVNIKTSGPDHRFLMALLEVRQRARDARLFEWADAIRDVLTESGWKIEDTPAGPRAIREEHRAEST